MGRILPSHAGVAAAASGLLGARQPLPRLPTVGEVYTDVGVVGVLGGAGSLLGVISGAFGQLSTLMEHPGIPEEDMLGTLRRARVPAPASGGAWRALTPTALGRYGRPGGFHAAFWLRQRPQPCQAWGPSSTALAVVATGAPAPSASKRTKRSTLVDITAEAGLASLPTHSM